MLQALDALKNGNRQALHTNLCAVKEGVDNQAYREFLAWLRNAAGHFFMQINDVS